MMDDKKIVKRPGYYYVELPIEEGPALIDALTLALDKLRLNGDEDEAMHNCMYAIENAYNTEVDVEHGSVDV